MNFAKILMVSATLSLSVHGDDVRALSSPDRGARHEAFARLVKAGPSAYPALRWALDRGHEDARYLARLTKEAWLSQYAKARVLALIFMDGPTFVFRDYFEDGMDDRAFGEAVEWSWRVFGVPKERCPGPLSHDHGLSLTRFHLRGGEVSDATLDAPFGRGFAEQYQRYGRWWPIHGEKWAEQQKKLLGPPRR